MIKILEKKIFSLLKNRDVRIIIANFNQTIATHMFCHVNVFYKFSFNHFDYYRQLEKRFMVLVINGLFLVIHLYQHGGMNQVSVR